MFRGLTRQLDPLQIKQVQIDGQLVGAEQYRDPFKSGRQGVFSHLDRSRGYALIDIRVLSKGSHVLQLNVGLLLSGSGNAGNVQDSWDRSSRERNIYVEQSFEMVGPLPEPVMVPLDEVLAKTLQEATTVAVKSDMHGFLIEVSFDPSQLPIGLSGEAVLRFPNERLIYLGRLQVLPSRHNDEDSRSTYKYHPWQTGFEAEDHMVEEPVTVEIIPWADHAMFRHAQSVDEPLHMLGDVAVLGVIEPDQLREGLPDHWREGLNHD